MHGMYKVYSSWVDALKLGQQAANELQAGSCDSLCKAQASWTELGLQSSWAGIKLRQAGGADELHSWAATRLRSCAMCK